MDNVFKLKCVRCDKEVEPNLTISGPHVRADCPECGIKDYLKIAHPAARGTIRKKENYLRHVKSILVDK